MCPNINLQGRILWAPKFICIAYMPEYSIGGVYIKGLGLDRDKHNLSQSSLTRLILDILHAHCSIFIN